MEIMTMKKMTMYAQLYEVQRKLRSACDQIMSLSEKKAEFERHYTKAVRSDNGRFRYTLRMRIVIVEGLIDYYCKYAILKENEMLGLRFNLNGEVPDNAELVFDSENE